MTRMAVWLALIGRAVRTVTVSSAGRGLADGVAFRVARPLASGGVCAEPELLTPISRVDRLRAMNGWVGIDALVWVGGCRGGQIGSSSVRKLVALGGEWGSAKASIGTVP